MLKDRSLEDFTSKRLVPMHPGLEHKMQIRPIRWSTKAQVNIGNVPLYKLISNRIVPSIKKIASSNQSIFGNTSMLCKNARAEVETKEVSQKVDSLMLSLSVSRSTSVFASSDTYTYEGSSSKSTVF
jgi:hypothetical protein